MLFRFAPHDPPERTGAIELPIPMTAQEWAYLLRLLEAIRPGFVPEDAMTTEG